MTMPKTFWGGIRKKLLSFAKHKVCSMNHLLTVTEPWSHLAFYPLKQREVGWWVMQVVMLLSHPTHTAQGAACCKSVFGRWGLLQRDLLADASFLLYYYYCTHFCPDLWFPPLWRQCLKWQNHPIAQSWAGMYITAPRNRFRFEVFISELDCYEITIKSFNFVVHSGSKWSEVLDEFCSELVYTAKLSVITVHYLLCHNSPCGCSLWKTSVDQVLAKW